MNKVLFGTIGYRKGAIDWQSLPSWTSPFDDGCCQETESITVMLCLVLSGKMPALNCCGSFEIFFLLKRFLGLLFLVIILLAELILWYYRRYTVMNSRVHMLLKSHHT
jgi:hypothetical protein